MEFFLQLYIILPIVYNRLIPAHNINKSTAGIVLDGFIWTPHLNTYYIFSANLSLGLCKY